jgi:hypothetical protein
MILEDSYACTFEMLSVTEPPLSLQYGVLIQAKVRAQNAFGWGDYSDVNTDG